MLIVWAIEESQYVQEQVLYRCCLQYVQCERVKSLNHHDECSCNSFRQYRHVWFCEVLWTAVSSQQSPLKHYCSPDQTATTYNHSASWPRLGSPNKVRTEPWQTNQPDFGLKVSQRTCDVAQVRIITLWRSRKGADPTKRRSINRLGGGGDAVSDSSH